MRRSRLRLLLRALLIYIALLVSSHIYLHFVYGGLLHSFFHPTMERKSATICLPPRAILRSGIPSGENPPPHNPSFRTKSPEGCDGETLRIAYIDRGKGDALLLIHGSPGSADNFQRMIPDLEKHYRVIAPDFPGFGGSSRKAPDYGIIAGARYYFALMDRLGIEKAHLFGYSFGSGIALYMERMHPERVRSVTIYGGMGVMDAEGTGDYRIERIKYRLGQISIVALPELIPHFGLLGPLPYRRAFMDNFLDTDLRPMREVIRSVRSPFCIIQGLHDPLFPAWAARLHHDLARNSELYMLDASHFLPFSDSGARRLTELLLPFLRRADKPGAKAIRITHDLPDRAPELPMEIGVRKRMDPYSSSLAILAGTLVSEDLTCIATGLLIRDHTLDLFLGIFACFAGIFLGDTGLWLLGRLFSGPLRHTALFRRFIPENRFRLWEEWFHRYGWSAVVMSRFLPGTRFVTYVGAGILGKSALRFMGWVFLAGAIWTPFLVIMAALFGPAVARPFQHIFGPGWVALLGTLLLLLLFARAVLLLATHEGRQRLLAKIGRMRHHEFWPAWLFYTPAICWIAWLSLRYRGITLFTASNPGMPHGGVVGESKAEILSHLPEEWTLPSRLLPLHAKRADQGETARTAHTHEERLALLEEWMQRETIPYPVILKPDAAQRGVGVRLAKDRSAALHYFLHAPYDVLAQRYHPGPHEAGILYYRIPGEERGRIFSITDKVFPVLAGNGASTIRELIWDHPRYRMQADIFLKRYESHQEEIPAEGEMVPLSVAGNHCQGTQFLDGSHLIMPELEYRIDSIARNYNGFYVGRFDVRYTNPDAFRRGEDLAIVELNGVLGESTNLYDRSFCLLKAYRILFRHMELVYRIGAINRSTGTKPTPLFELGRWILRYYRERNMDPLSD